MEKDYSLLRQFDLEAAKRGEPICFDQDGHLATFLGESDQVEQDICIRWDETIDIVQKDKCAMLHRECLRMAPLCWVEGKPVYKGEPLWTKSGVKHYADRYDASTGAVFQDHGRDGAIPGSAKILDLTWTPPKVKREAWVNVYKNSNEVYRHDTKEKADTAARMVIGIIDPNRIACVRIEWEE